MTKKKISCNATALTTGHRQTSALEWARLHSHAPENGKIGVINSSESLAVMEVLRLWSWYGLNSNADH